jgi:hypothetical protein
MGAGMLRELHLRSQAQITPAWSWQQAALFIGFVMPLGGLLWALSMGGLAPFSWLGILLWLIALAAACALVWKGDSVAAWLQGYTAGCGFVGPGLALSCPVAGIGAPVEYCSHCVSGC